MSSYFDEKDEFLTKTKDISDIDTQNNDASLVSKYKIRKKNIIIFPDVNVKAIKNNKGPSGTKDIDDVDKNREI